MAGGDRKTLTPAGHYADNNHIHHTSGHGEGFYLGTNNKPDGSTAGYMFDSLVEGNTASTASHGHGGGVYLYQSDATLDGNDITFNDMLDGDGNANPLGAGEFAFVPPNETHQFRNTGDEPFVFICAVPKEYE